MKLLSFFDLFSTGLKCVLSFSCRFSGVLFASVILSGAADLYADEVLLTNGDRISCDVIRMKDNVLFIRTEYSGDITVKWDYIANIHTDDDIDVVLDDDTLISGTGCESEEGTIRLSAEADREAEQVLLEDVKVINPEPAGDTPDTKIKALLNFGLTSTKGNTEKESKHFTGEYTARTIKNRYTIGGMLNRTEDCGRETENSTLAYVRHDHFLSEKWFINLNTLFEKNKAKDLDLRSVVGLASGFQFFESEEKSLSVEMGISHVNEEYISPNEMEYSSSRWAVSYNKYFVNKSIEFFHYNEGLLSIEDTDDLIIKSRTGFRIPLFSNINTTLQYNYDWERTPVPGREESDRKIMFSIGYKFENNNG